MICLVYSMQQSLANGRLNFKVRFYFIKYLETSIGFEPSKALVMNRKFIEGTKLRDRQAFFWYLFVTSIRLKPSKIFVMIKECFDQTALHRRQVFFVISCRIRVVMTVRKKFEISITDIRWVINIRAVCFRWPMD